MKQRVSTNMIQQKNHWKTYISKSSSDFIFSSSLLLLCYSFLTRNAPKPPQKNVYIYVCGFETYSNKSMSENINNTIKIINNIYPLSFL